MFENFQRKQIDTSGATINIVVGGSGPPVLLLHGYPETHAMWHLVAPRLASDFTVVAADLRGYGDSSKPDGGDDHAAYSKRALAQDNVEVMAALGFDRFAVVGHDRGARVAYRMALDHADRVTKLALLDIIPTLTMYTMANRGLATAYYHWFMLVQPFDLPEQLIGSSAEYFLRTSLDRWSGGNIAAFAEEAIAEYLRCFCTPETIHATCEDYRAGATIDCAHDEADFGKRKIACPTLVLCGRALSRIDPVAIWSEWADDVRGAELPCGHFLPEEAPDETYTALREFLSS